MNNDNLSIVKNRAESWLNGNYDEETKQEVRKLMESESELTDSFYRDLEFGTGGLRGIFSIHHDDNFRTLFSFALYVDDAFYGLDTAHDIGIAHSRVLFR